MVLLFVVLAAAGTAYFVAARRTFDLIGVAFLSSVAYFAPGFWGMDLFSQALDPRAYLVFVSVLAAVLLTGVLSDASSLRLRPPGRLYGEELFGTAMLLIAAASVASIFVHPGIGSLFVHKRESGVLEAQYMPWRVGAGLALVHGALLRRRSVMIGAGLLLVLNFFASHRSGVTLAGLAAATAYLQQQGRARVLVRNVGLLLIGLCVLPFIVFGKLIQAAVVIASVGGDPLRALDGYGLDGETLTRLAVNTEPFSIQAILNEVLRHDFRVGGAHLAQVPLQILPTPSAVGARSSAFNDLFQPVLFPDQPLASMAYNPWAEGIAAAGWLGHGAFVAVYLSGLVLFAWLCRSPSSYWRAVAYLAGAYWAFYFHRNSLASILTYERHILYTSVVVVGACAVLTAVGRVRRHTPPPAGADAAVALT